MRQPTISIIIPSAGRDTLPYCLQTITQQSLIPGDEILIIGDGTQKEVEAQVEAIGEPFRYIEGPHTNDWGHSQTNLGISVAKADWLMFTDDDDGYLPRALEVVRSAISTAPAQPALFRFITNDRHLVWRNADNGRIDETLVGGHNLALPRSQQWMEHAKWTERYRGDFDFVRGVLDSYPRRDWNWRPEILTRQRPDRELAWWAVRTDEQFEALRQLRNECRETMTRHRNVILPAEQTEFAVRVRDSRPPMIWPFLFSLREEQPFEYCGWMLLRREEGKMLVSYGLGEKFRGKGLARPIFQFALDGCMEDAYAEVLETNAASLHVHHELSWITEKTKDGIVYLKHPYPPV